MGNKKADSGVAVAVGQTKPVTAEAGHARGWQQRDKRRLKLVRHQVRAARKSTHQG